MATSAALPDMPLVVCLGPTREDVVRLREDGNRVAVVVPPGEPVENLVTWCEAVFTVDVEGAGFAAFLRDVVPTLRPRAVAAGSRGSGGRAASAARLLGVPLLAGAGPAGSSGCGRANGGR